MAAAIRIKLADLLFLLMDKSLVAHEAKVRQTRLPAIQEKAERRPLIEKDLETIKAYLLNGPARRRDLAMELNMSDNAVLHRLGMLKARGVVVYLPDRNYQLTGAV